MRVRWLRNLSLTPLVLLLKLSHRSIGYDPLSFKYHQLFIMSSQITFVQLFEETFCLMLSFMQCGRLCIYCWEGWGVGKGFPSLRKGQEFSCAV